MSAQAAPGGRREARAAALQRATEFLTGVEDDTSPAVEIIREMVAANSPRPTVKAERVPLEKADPTVVRDYFAATGLNRKQLASAAGVSTSVIATVQNPEGDRWSQQTFEAKQALISQWMQDHAEEVAAEHAAIAERIAAREAKAAARTERRAQREARRAEAAATPAAAPSPNPTNQTGGSVTAARRRPRKTQDAASTTAAATA